jgi:hypothetical protein
MQNPFGSEQVPGSYHNLKERMYKKVLANVNDQLLVIVQNAYENALRSENVMLARAERKQLFDQILRMILEDILKKH